MRFVIAGSGGFSREVADLVIELGHEVVAFFDEHPATTGHVPTGLPVVRDPGAIEFDAVAVAIGDAAARERIFATFAEWPKPVLAHRSASVSPSAVIGEGSIVMHNAVVSAQASLGRGVIVNVGCYVAHDCSVGEFTHLAAGVNLGGGATVGPGCLCGTGTIVLPRVAIGSAVVTGAGAVVTRDVADGVVVTGVPARILPAAE
ncbi:MAG TPA: acetyltransferase [Coriobacteriia bacterium]|nr:acetyltransferase [Coriobacteriia bacterium]